MEVGLRRVGGVRGALAPGSIGNPIMVRNEGGGSGGGPSGNGPKNEEEKKGEHWHLRERRFGSFQRAISLSTPVDSDKAQAQFEHGVLTLTLPKSEQAKPRQIKIGGAQK